MSEPGSRETPSRVTQLLREWQGGDEAAGRDLATEIYGELKRIAAGRLRQERRDHTLQPTALVNEAWLRLANVDADWQNRSHFLGVAAVAMRRILVDHARRRDTAKRSGGAQVVVEDLDAIPSPMPDQRLLALDEALTRLATLDPRQAHVVELRYFAGLSIEETAETMGISTGTVKREWAAARAWLFDAMQRASGG